MKNVLDWIKHNVITVIAIGIVLVSLVLIYLTHTGKQAVRDSMSAVSTTLAKVDGAKSSRVTIPPRSPDEPPRPIQIPINQASIEKLKEAYDRMNEEHNDIRRLTLEFNEGTGDNRHRPIIDGLFPDPGNDPIKPYDGREAFIERFPELLASIGGELRMSVQDADAMVIRLKREYLQRNFTPPLRLEDEGTLNTEAKAKLRQAVVEGLVKGLQDHAKGAHVYVDNITVNSADFPFHVPPWLFNATIEKLEMHQFWELQMLLWIQQDIARAIAITNRVGDPKSNVINSPIKRLLRLRVADGYVGINAPGAVRGGAQDFQVGTNNGAAATSQALLTANPDRPLQENYNISPTGRLSNVVYDVRHVTLSMVVDYRELPIFIENLARVNFMTVLHMTAKDVDEYDALTDRYVYGTGDAVQVDMVIETIWLREWTRKYMPASVKADLGVAADK